MQSARAGRDRGRGPCTGVLRASLLCQPLHRLHQCASHHVHAPAPAAGSGRQQGRQCQFRHCRLVRILGAGARTTAVRYRCSSCQHSQAALPACHDMSCQSLHECAAQHSRAEALPLCLRVRFVRPRPALQRAEVVRALPLGLQWASCTCSHGLGLQRYSPAQQLGLTLALPSQVQGMQWQ